MTSRAPLSVASFSRSFVLLTLICVTSLIVVCAMSITNENPLPSQSSSSPTRKLKPSFPKRALTPPFPNGPCGGTVLDIAPEETFGADVNLSSINVLGDMILLPRTIRIWLPPGYSNIGEINDNGEGRHPVLYVHDGQNAMQDEESWTGASWRLTGALTRLADHKLIGAMNGQLPIVVLLPSAEGDWLPGVRRRHLEYGDMNFPFAQAHADFVASTVKPLVDNRFRTDPRPEKNLVMGSSLGGQASLHLLLRHPDKFGGAACLSPAFGPAILDYVASSKGQEILRNAKKKLYLDIGGDMSTDSNGEIGDNFVRVPPIDLLDHLTPVHGWNPGYFWLDTQLQGQVEEMRRILDRAGIDYKFRKYPGGRHNERAWALRIDKPLLHLFSNGDVVLEDVVGKDCKL